VADVSGLEELVACLQALDELEAEGVPELAELADHWTGGGDHLADLFQYRRTSVLLEAAFRTGSSRTVRSSLAILRTNCCSSSRSKQYKAMSAMLSSSASANKLAGTKHRAGHLNREKLRIRKSGERAEFPNS
jgi:hypothetical protein